MGRIEGIPGLVHVAEFDRVTEGETAAVGLLVPGDHAEERGLAGAVGADDADDGARRQDEINVLHQQHVAVSLGQPAGHDHLVAQPRPRRDDDFGGARAALAGLGQERIVSGEARLSLRLAGPGRKADPLEFTPQGAPPRAVLLFLLGQPLFLLLQPGRIISLIGDAPPPVQFEDPPGHVVQEVAVVGDHHDHALVVRQEAFQPGHGFGVQVVGGLVQEQDAGAAEQEPAERHPPPLAAGQLGHVGVAGRAAQRVHGHLDGAFQLPASGVVDFLL